ncbi:MAG: type transport system ATP-binding protein [Actinomycetota bacterium]|nr:type transport system ATP-binding protein [Actinomycetota bacterium]
MSTGDAAVRWVGVGLQVAGRALLDDVHLTARRGTVLGLVGANGAGKTSLLKIACGLWQPTAGSVEVDGHAVGASPRPGVAAMIEEPRFYPWAHAVDNLKAVAVGRAEQLDRIATTLDQVGLSAADKRPVRQYSQGMRQRLGMARALLGDPHILLLDEPTNGLDPDGLAWLRGLVKSLRDQGRTVVLSSHGLSQLERDADEVAVVAAGRVLVQGPMREVVGDAPSLEDLYFRLTT